MATKREQVNLRMDERLRNKLSAYAGEKELSFNAAIIRLIETGFASEEGTAPRTPAAQRIEQKAAPTREEAATGRKQPSGDKKHCVHRVALTSYCSRCGA